MVGTELIPQIKPEEQLRPGWHEEWYQQLVDRWNPPFEIPNVHFHYYHDDFFNRHMSIRAARDWRNHPFWLWIAILFFMGVTGVHWSLRLIKPFIPELDLPDLS